MNMTANKKSLSVVFTVLVALLTTLGFLAALPGRSQSTSKTDSAHVVRPQVAPQTRLNAATTSRSDAPAVNPAFAPAATQNAALSNNLEWTFGSKQQRGWYLYAPLIAETLKTGGDADTTEFAQALSRWQSSVGLAPNGVLDQNTWFKMFSTWQSRRL
jgi:hypothetical protein